eukprot:7895018-Pyramimonas_sp.AAC.1
MALCLSCFLEARTHLPTRSEGVFSHPTRYRYGGLSQRPSKGRTSVQYGPALGHTSRATSRGPDRDDQLGLLVALEVGGNLGRRGPYPKNVGDGGDLRGGLSSSP